MKCPMIIKEAASKFILPAIAAGVAVPLVIGYHLRHKDIREKIKKEIKDPRWMHNIRGKLMGKSREEIVAGHKNLKGYPFRDEV